LLPVQGLCQKEQQSQRRSPLHNYLKKKGGGGRRRNRPSDGKKRKKIPPGREKGGEFVVRPSGKKGIGQSEKTSHELIRRKEAPSLSERKKKKEKKKREIYGGRVKGSFP